MRKHSYPIFCIFLFGFISTFEVSFSQGSWETIETPTQQNLRSVYFTDSLFGWAVGDSGTIIHTEDGGGSWSFQDGKTANQIVDVFFLDRNLGWASSFNFSSIPYGTLLLKTTNGGNDWVTRPYPEDNLFMNCILFLDSLNGWMGGSPHAIVRTTDGGITWNQAEIDTSALAFFPVLSIRFYDENYGYAGGGMFDIAGVTWRTNDGGNKWYAIDISDAPADEVHALHLFDSITVMGAGGDPDFGYGVGLLRTGDGGYNWDYEELGIQGNAYDLDFRNENEAWAPLGSRNKLIYSLDSGNIWAEISSPDLTSIYDMHFPDSLHGFAVGRDGAMIKYTPPVSVTVESYFPENSTLKLHQNSPNPFSQKTGIRFEIPETNFELHTRLAVYNSHGKQVAVLIDKNLSPGNYQVNFSASDLPSGIYYYKLLVAAGNRHQLFGVTKKMVLTK